MHERFDVGHELVEPLGRLVLKFLKEIWKFEVYYYIGERPKLKRETDNSGV